jgi:elongation factor 2
MQTMDSVPCGNTVCLSGLDANMGKTGTVTTSFEASKFKEMKLAVSAVVRVSIAPKNMADLPKVIEGLKRLSKSDPLVEVAIEETGELTIAGSGDLHIEICINDLRDFSKVDIVVGQPVVPYRETVIDMSQVCLAKSPNKHNRLYVTAEPLSNELVNDIDNKKFLVTGDQKRVSKALVDTYGWDADTSKKIWGFGPETKPLNCITDCTKGAQYMRGVRFNIMDVTLHADSIHRGGGQLIPTTRQVLNAAMISAKPRLMEPYYLVQITVSEDAKGGVYSTLNKRRGEIFEEENKEGTPLYNMKAYLPVAESFGFTAALREATGGKAFPQCQFNHWQIIQEDPYDPSTKVHQIVKAIRKRKGLKEELPKFEDYNDKL